MKCLIGNAKWLVTIIMYVPGDPTSASVLAAIARPPKIK